MTTMHPLALTPTEAQRLVARGLMAYPPQGDWRKQTPKNIRTRESMKRLREKRAQQKETWP